MKLFTINEKILRKTISALETFRDTKDEECAVNGCMCDLRERVCSQWISDILHDLESGVTLK